MVALTILPVPKIMKRRLASRTPTAVKVVRYLDGLTPNARARLIRDAWKRANPRWTVP